MRCGLIILVYCLRSLVYPHKKDVFAEMTTELEIFCNIFVLELNCAKSLKQNVNDMFWVAMLVRRSVGPQKA